MKTNFSAFRPLRLLKYLFKKPLTMSMHDIFVEPRETADNYRGFHTNDWDECIGCSACAEICPTEAIIMVDRDELEETDGNFASRPTIDYGRCCFCALCVDICSTGSLNMSKEYLLNSPEPEDYYRMPVTGTFLDEPARMGYQKNEISDLLELKRVPMEHVSAEERFDSFIEVVKGYSKEQAIHEAARCIECNICTKTCPAHMNIPEYIRSIWEEDFEAGVELCYRTNPLPASCGRVCTHNCETACALTQRGEAIAIRWLKRYIIDNAPQDIYEKVIMEQVSEKLDGRIAIVGSGPAGLAAAYYLRTIGYDVDVYEQLDVPGGMIRFGIPTYRLPNEVVDREVAFIESIGVNFHYNTKLGQDIELDDLKEEYDAVFVAIGAWRASTTGIKNEDNKAVLGGIDFLRDAVNQVDTKLGKRVAVIGGGNTAMDVARTARRLGADVTVLYRRTEQQMPVDFDEVIEGREEGIDFKFLVQPTEILVEDGKVVGIRNQEMMLGEPDASGRQRPVPIEGAISDLPFDTVINAVGQGVDMGKITNIDTTRWGTIQINDLYETSLDNVFAGGDDVLTLDIITAVAQGHNAALSIDSYIAKKKQKVS